MTCFWNPQTNRHKIVRLSSPQFDQVGITFQIAWEQQLRAFVVKLISLIASAESQQSSRVNSISIRTEKNYDGNVIYSAKIQSSVECNFVAWKI